MSIIKKRKFTDRGIQELIFGDYFEMRTSCEITTDTETFREKVVNTCIDLDEGGELQFDDVQMMRNMNLRMRNSLDAFVKHNFS